MNKNRLLVYDIPHKAIRYALSQFSLLAGNTDYNNKEEIGKLKNVADDIFRLLEEHAVHENNVPLRDLEQKVPGSSTHDLGDHEKIEAQTDKLRKDFNELYERSGKGEDLMYPGNEFFMNVSDFQSQYIQHMLEEERVTQPLLWKNFTDEELHLQELEIKQNIKPEEMLVWCKYMFPSFTKKATVRMLKEIKDMAPEEFFKAVMSLAKSVLPGEDYVEIERAMNNE